MRLLAISGSLRKDSLNTKLARAAARLAPAGVEVDVVTLHGLPMYDEDLHGLGTPEPVAQLAARVRAADGVLIVTPVHWYQVSAPLKLMMDRMVCADGGNPDPTLTHGKDAATAKAVELAGWDYPRHLAGRLFGLLRACAESVEALRQLRDLRASKDVLQIPHTERDIGQRTRRPYDRLRPSILGHRVDRSERRSEAEVVLRSAWRRRGGRRRSC